MAQWLGFGIFHGWAWVQFLVGDPRSYKMQGMAKKKKLQRQYHYMTESLKKKGKKKNLPLPHSLTQPGLHFGLLPSRSFSNNCDSSGSGGEGSQWADTQVNGGLMEQRESLVPKGRPGLGLWGRAHAGFIHSGLPCGSSQKLVLNWASRVLGRLPCHHRWLSVTS